MSIGIDIINNDLAIHEGKLQFIQKESKAARDFKKMLSTDACGTSEDLTYYRYNKSYGLLLNKMEYYKGLSQSAKVDMVKLLLSQGISNYIKVQESRSNLSLEEIISNIDFYAVPSTADKSIILVNIVLTLASGQQINLGPYEQSV